MVTELGMEIDVRSLQPENASCPIDLTELGMVNEVSLQHQNAASPMDLIVLGMIVFLQPATSVLVEVSIIALQLSRESYLVLPGSTTIDSRLSSANAPIPMDLIELGMLIDIKLHPLNA